MTQITFTPADRAAIAHAVALGKVAERAGLQMARMVVADPERYGPLLPWAKLVLEPVLPEQEQREAA